LLVARNLAAAWAIGLVMALVATPVLAAASFPVEVRGVDDKALRGEIQDALTAFPAAPSSRLEARRRATESADKIVAVLRSEGYYDATVTADIGDGDTPVAFVDVRPGPRSKLADPAIVWIGPPPAADVAAAASKVMALKVGDPGRAEAVIAAEGRIVAALREHGHADAVAQPREVIVDHATLTVQPTYHIAAGPVVRLDGVELNGTSRTRADWVRALAPWKAGQTYRPEDVAELERRLTESGVFESVGVALAPASEAVGGPRPVIVSLTDRPKAALELGGSYSTSEGAGVDSRWIVYNHLNRADTITTSLLVAQIESKLETALALPDWDKPGQTLKLAAAIYNDDTPAYNSTGAVISADVTQRFGKLSFWTYGVSLDGSDTVEKETANYVHSDRIRALVTGALLGSFFLDRSNDPLDPTSGWRWQARIEPTYALGDGSIGYVKASSQVSGYLPVGDVGTVIAARLNLGSIVGGNIPLVPAPARFYAGGGGSVRGYAYQAVGPRYGDNTPEGGLSLFESSLELRQRVTSQWGVVAFIDSGDVGSRVNPDLSHLQFGAGLGVRYNLGFGPIRLDLATPLNPREGDAALQLYLSIGQSF
jgi:translocation and assembly module TamA